MDGLDLLRTLVESTGLPTDSVESELNRLITRQGISPDQVTLDDIREILATYLQETLLDAKESLDV